MSVDTVFIEDLRQFALLEPRWNALVRRSATSTCHSTFEWLFTWWKHFGPGRRLLLVTACENGALAGIAPFFVDDRASGAGCLHFIGQGLSDYADLVVPCGRQDVAEALLCALLQRQAEWKAVDLEEVPIDSPYRTQLERLAETVDADACWVPTVRCPYLPVDSTWDVYFRSRGEGFRHNIQNKLNRCKRDGVHLHYVDRMSVNSTFIDEIVDLSSRRQKVDGHRSPFLNHPDQEFLREVLPLMGDRGMLRISEVRIGNSLGGFALAFCWQRTMYDWNTQYDPGYATYSLGRIALVHLAKRAFEEGYAEFDFMRGEEEYKFQWTSLARSNTALRSEVSCGDRGGA